ncbi:MAG: type I DNA topoisomerase [Oligoflexales bacterium]|nr:type I DNA topoisomerase [Oligoflexales bacterium]
MAKALVIVESPAKAKTINKYLGPDYIVKSSIGHIRDLPSSAESRAAADEKSQSEKAEKAEKLTKKSAAKGASLSLAEKAKQKEQRAQDSFIRRMGVDPENGWKAQYEILPGKEKVLSELQKIAEKADRIFLATDLDREGEAIAWHLREAIGGDHSKYKRVTFAEITQKAIEAAFAKPDVVNMNRVNAQMARRFLDRVVGFMLSPLLWKKVARGLSAGRVQSVAVRLVTERETEIRAFKPDEYWELFAHLAADRELIAQVVKYKGENFRPDNGKDAASAVSFLEGATYKVTERVDKPSSSRPSAPFITSTLQQSASVRLGFGVKKTMMMAQRLYEGGYITYMRTDSTHLGEEAVEDCRKYIKRNYGPDYLPAEKLVYTSKEKAQEAHEAIRPSSVSVVAEQLRDMDKDAVKLYELIWRQFVSCQMTPALYDTTALNFEIGDYVLRARGRVLRFAGWTKVQTPISRKGEEDALLPDVKVGQILKLKKLDSLQKFTKPPPRYTEASLVKALEAQGIGRPSTYAAIISTIQDRGYVKVERRRFFLQKMGEIVTLRLNENFPDLMDYGFTAGLEDNLDEIALGQVEWKSVLDEFYGNFKKEVEVADQQMRSNEPITIDFPCPTCGRQMAVRTAKTGVFLSCTGYALPPKERCTATINLQPGEEVVSIGNDDDEEEGDVEEIRSKRRCQKCDALMDSYLIDETRKLHVCGNSPDCTGYEIETGQFKIKGYDGPLIECDRCGKDMQLKTGRFGKYFACTAYPDCKNTRKLLRNGEAAPPKEDPVHMRELKCEKSDGYFVLRDGAAGLFLASSAFPKSRETRAPYVDELAPHRNEMAEKFRFIADGPKLDSQGRRVMVRFRRKEKEHYLRTEVDGKPSGWEANWDGKTWRVQEKAEKSDKAELTKK